MIEKEAKEKWCPMAAAIQMANKSSQKCIASECMAWVWITEKTEDNSKRWGRCGLVK